MIYLAAFLTVTVFVVALWRLGIVPEATEAIAVSRNSAKSIRDPALSDEDKERLVRRASLTLLRGFLAITWRGAAAVGISLLPMLAFDVAGLADFRAVADFLATWEAIVVASVVITLVYWVGKRL